MADRRNAFMSELLQTIAGRSLRWFGRGSAWAEKEGDPRFLAQSLLSTRGEASGVALARALVEAWQRLDDKARLQWFRMLAEEFGVRPEALREAAEAWLAAPTALAASRLHTASEPSRQELFRRINLAPGGTATLVRMREFLLQHVNGDGALEAVEHDLAHLLNSWFNRGFLLLNRIDWSSPASVLEKIIRYEAVHQIRNWEDLRSRLEPADRRCFAFFHPQMHDEPLIFVEVALTRGLPAEIAALIAEDRVVAADNDFDTAVFYSISNTQPGLRGVSLGNFLIKQVVEELLRERNGLKTFVTLSPVPGFAAWLAKRTQEGEEGGAGIAPGLAEDLADPLWHANEEVRARVEPALKRAAAHYLLKAKAADGKPLDPVARFHLNNGARLERLNHCADLSAKGLRQSHGLMVNYLYDLDSIERHHERYANASEVAAAAGVRRLLAGADQVSLTRNIQSLLKTGKARPAR